VFDPVSVGFVVQPAVAAAERHMRPLAGDLAPRRRGLGPRLLAAVIRSNATSAFAAERQVVGQTEGLFGTTRLVSAKDLDGGGPGSVLGEIQQESQPVE
jgi:hypothetical protein